MDTPRRISADTGQGLGRLVLAVLEVVAELLERQALRRMASGSLTEVEVERLGQGLLSLRRQFEELRAVLDVPERKADAAHVKQSERIQS
ncbi:gas vesicle protein K [Amycolatopsis sp. RTGN1]|uniref:gas vesicle protein K n=1 Tax=Amycolatopsis ponsaeliensis TaxID=2992142 RepID=UPI00254B366D|nr:gas vesicle protein K [Amycolatopsis sp. RTGN1]